MSILKKFRNITYPYRTDDDTFIARGYHLNVLVDAINDIDTGVNVPIDAAGSADIILGLSKDIDAAFIDYKLHCPDTVITDYDQSGHLEVNNSLEHPEPARQAVTWTRESTNHAAGSGSEEVVTFAFLKVGADLIMRVTNTTGEPMQLTFTANILTYATS